MKLFPVLSGLLIAAGMPFAAIAQTDGHWVLVDTEYRLGDETFSSYQPGRQIGDESGSVEAAERGATVMSRSRGDADVQLRTRWSWSAPPRVIRPDRPVRISVEAETLGNTATDWGFGHQLFIQSTNPPVLDGDFRVIEPAGLDLTNRLAINSNNTGNVRGSGSFVMSRTMAQGWGSGEPFIQVRVGDGAVNTYAVNYIYEWRAGPGPEPDGEDPPAAPDQPTVTDPGTVPPGPADPTAMPDTAGDPVDPSAAPGVPAGPERLTEPARVDAMTLQIGTRRVVQGQTVTIPVWLLRSSGVANMNFNIRYDSGVALAVEGGGAGNLTGRALFEVNPREAGLARLGFAQNTDLSGDGTVAQMPFRAVGAPGTRTPLTLEVTTVAGAAGGAPAVALIHGEILVVGPDGLIPGDADGDGQITARDAAEALKMSVGLIPVKMVCDVDGDGQVTSTDARLILARATGK